MEGWTDYPELIRQYKEQIKAINGLLASVRERRPLGWEKQAEDLVSMRSGLRESINDMQRYINQTRRKGR